MGARGQLENTLAAPSLGAPVPCRDIEHPSQPLPATHSPVRRPTEVHAATLHACRSLHTGEAIHYP